jgi:hypothetical protein
MMIEHASFLVSGKTPPGAAPVMNGRSPMDRTGFCRQYKKAKAIRIRSAGNACLPSMPSPETLEANSKTTDASRLGLERSAILPVTERDTQGVAVLVAFAVRTPAKSKGAAVARRALEAC